MSLKHLLCELKKYWKQIGSRTVSTCTICTSKYSALAIRNFPLDVIRETARSIRIALNIRAEVRSCAPFSCVMQSMSRSWVWHTVLTFSVGHLQVRVQPAALCCAQKYFQSRQHWESLVQKFHSRTVCPKISHGRVSKESYTLSKKPCSLWQLNYGTNMLVALVVGTLGRIFFHFLCRFAGCLECNPASCHDISLYDCTPCVINHFSLSGFPGFSLGFKIV